MLGTNAIAFISELGLGVKGAKGAKKRSLLLSESNGQ
jgi:hypothetical protein